MSLDKIPARTDIKPLPRHTLEGAFSRHFAYQDADGKPLLRRRPLTDPAWQDRIKSNMDQWDFDKHGGTITVRSEEEIQTFVAEALQAGLRVVPVTSDGAGGSFAPYLENAVTLDTYLKSASDEDARRVVGELFDDIAKAHRAGIVYGDRWYNNILVDPERSVINIDFDFKLEGPGKELDLAQEIFFTVALDRNRTPSTLLPLLKNMREDHDLTLVRKFVETKERQSREKYGDLSEVFRVLFEQLDLDWTSPMPHHLF